MLGGLVEWGVLIEVMFDSYVFVGDGDVMLFGELLYWFFVFYVDINLFMKFVIVSLLLQVWIEWLCSKVEWVLL